ncbi:MAG: DUF2283 domain-containing protein, partial [Bdellovibrionales bacterium]|nr:DUF2283 domain-containing protein [Bdellovibrionales bacterium]
KVSEDDPDVAYLQLPDHPGVGTLNVVGKQVDLRELIQDYAGPDVYLDFGQDGKLIGIEIMA